MTDPSRIVPRAGSRVGGHPCRKVPFAMFLLIERDPFVRTDMCLTLCEGFPDVEVISVASVESAQRDSPAALRPRLVLIDTRPEDPLTMVQFDLWQRDRTPVLLTNAGGDDAGNGHPSLARPFTAQMLVEAVQAAMRTMA